MQSNQYYYSTDQQPATTTDTTGPYLYQSTLHDSANNESNALVIPLSAHLFHVVSLSSLGHVLTYPPFC